MMKDTGIKIITADDSFATLVRPVVDRVDTSAEHWTNGNFAHVLLDFPLTWGI